MKKLMVNLFKVFMCLMLILTMSVDGYEVKAADNTNVMKIEDSVVSNDGELFHFQYFGNWRGESGYPDLFSNGDDHYSNYENDYFTMKFIGSRIAIYGTKRIAHGSYKVSIDGVEQATIVAESDTTAHQQLLWEIDNLANEEHLLKVENISSKAIQVDYVEVTYSNLTPTSIAAEEGDVVIEKDASHQINLIPTPSIASIDNITYISEDENIATVDNNGLVMARSIGKTKINIALADTNITTSVNIEVVDKLDALNVSIGDPYRLETQSDYSILNQQSNRQFKEVAWQNDHVVSKINVTSRNKNLTNVTLSCSDFTSGDNQINADQIKLSWLKWTDANIGRGNSSAPIESFPDIISDKQSIKLNANTVGFGWLAIDIPANQQPGVYRGVVRVDCNELSEPITLDYEIEVIALQVPSVKEVNMPIQLWQHPYSVANYYGVSESDYFTQEHFKYMEGSLREYSSIGGDDLVANIVEEAWGHQSYYGDPSMVKWKKNIDGSYSFDYTHFDAWVNFADQCGVIDIDQKQGRIKCYSIVPWNNRVTYYDEASQSNVSVSLTPGSEEWQNIWTIFLEDFMEHAKSLQIFDITYISMDERSVAELTPAVALIKSIKDSNNQSFKISSALNYSSSNQYTLTDQIDDISVGLGHISDANGEFKNFCEHRRALGLVTTFYTCTGNYPSNFTISDPGDNYWLMWYIMKEKADGYLRWAWDNWVADPLNNVTYRAWEPGDGWFIYPVEKDITHDKYYYLTPRYEMMKVAIKDVYKAKYLMTQNDTLANDINNLVDSLQRPLRGVNPYGSATYASEEQRELCLSEGKRMNQVIEQYAISYVNRQAGIIDKSLLLNKLNEAKAIDGKDYSETSYQALQNAITNAQTIYEKEDATQEQVDSICSALEVAISGLIEADLINYEANKDAITIEAVSDQCGVDGAPSEKDGLGTAEASLDYNNNTYWHSDYRNHDGEIHWIAYDLGKNYDVTKVSFLPRQNGTNGDIFEVKVYVSEDTTFEESDLVDSFEFEHEATVLKNRNEFKNCIFKATKRGRYVKMEVVHSGGSNTSQLDLYCSMSEARFYGKEISDVSTVDKVALVNKLNEAKAKQAQDYTSESFAILTAAITSAEGVNDDVNATQEEVDDAVKALDDAIKGLIDKPIVPSVDKKALVDKISEAKATSTDGKTEESAKALADAIKDGEAVNANANATQEEVNEAVIALDNAIKGLEDKPTPVVDKTNLEKAIKRASIYVEERLSAKDKVIYSAALTAAKALQTNENATQAEIDAATAALREAIKDVDSNMSFPDVKKDAWYYGVVDEAYARGLMGPTDNKKNTFSPDWNISRGMVATVLYRMAGAPNTTYVAKFPDVKEGEWYSNAIIWANKAGIINGYGDGNFGADNNITREQLAIMLRNYAMNIGKLDVNADVDLSQFEDEQAISSYAVSAVKWAVANHIISGKGGTSIAPTDNATRGECAKMFMMLQDLIIK